MRRAEYSDEHSGVPESLHNVLVLVITNLLAHFHSPIALYSTRSCLGRVSSGSRSGSGSGTGPSTLSHNSEWEPVEAEVEGCEDVDGMG